MISRVVATALLVAAATPACGVDYVADDAEYRCKQDPGACPCSLVVERAGPLPDPVAVKMSGPGIAATDDGFLVAYREQYGYALRAVIGFISDDKDLGAPSIFDLEGCSNKIVTDGVGVAYEGGVGLVATSLPDCGKGVGVLVVPFTSQGDIGSAQGAPNPAFSELTVAPNSLVAPAAIKGQYEILYRATSGGPPVIERVILDPNGPVAGAAILQPFGEDDIPFGMVTTSPQVRAFLAPVRTEGGQTTSVKIGNRATDAVDEKGSFDLPYADKATITAWNTKVAAAVPAAIGSTVTVANFINNAVSVDASGVVGSGNAYSTSLAALRSHLFVAQGHTGGITIHRLEGADSKIALKPADTVELPSSLGKTSLSTFDGTHMAIAAARNHVAVVWLSKPQLAEGDRSGGWALLQCVDE